MNQKPSERILEILENMHRWPDPNQGQLEAMEERLDDRINAIIQYLDEQHE